MAAILPLLTDFNLKAFLIEEELEFLIRSNGDQVSINDLDGKIIALYFSMSYTMGDLKWFDQELVELYTELASKGENFEVVYIINGSDHEYGDEEFKACFSKMPWLAIPPLELEIQDHLRKLFGPLPWYPALPIIDGRGRVLNVNVYEAFTNYDSDAYPFTPEKHTELKLKEDEQPLRFLLGSETRDFLIAYNGTKVPLSELEGKNVGVCLVPECDEEGGCEEFIHSMKTKLEKIKEGGEEFELVIIPIEAAYNEEKMNKVNFQHVFRDLACLSIPLSDKRCCKRLVRRFYRIYDRSLMMISGADGRRYEVHLPQLDNQQVLAPERDSVEKLDHELANLKSKSLESLLSSSDRDYVIGNGDIKVKISSLEGRTVILYFAPESVCCNTCTKFLVEAYHELHSKGEDLEVVFVSFHKDEHEFNQHLSKMSWLALPFSDTESHNKLRDLFPYATFGCLPMLVVRDRSGDILCTDALCDLMNYGSKAYPFTKERIDQVKKEDEILKKKKPQNLHKLLGSETRDFLISNTWSKVPISALEGKTIALYFRYHSYPGYYLEAYQQLEDIYFKLKERGEKFEIVSVFYNDDMTSPSSSSEEAFQGMPWLAVPLNDQETSERLFRYFHVFHYQRLIMVDPQGMILNNHILPDFSIVMNDLGDEGYPFTLEKIQEVLGDETRPFTVENYRKVSMKRKETSMRKPESVFISWQRDYLFGKDGIKFPASKLMGKTILLLWTEEIGEFEHKLIEIYPKIKEKSSEFEVIFISDPELFDKMFSAMPWLLAIGYRDLRVTSILHYFKLDLMDDDSCDLAAIHRLGSGHSPTRGWRLRELIMDFGADAYPFTKQRLRELEGSKDLENWKEAQLEEQ